MLDPQFYPYLEYALILQDYFVDKDSGLPLSGGVVTFYADNNRTLLKNVYYQMGAPGSYTYTALPNPLTLSAVGTISDGNGHDVIPYFFPYDEAQLPNIVQQAYYITVVNSIGANQFVRQFFGLNPGGATPLPPEPQSVPQNLLINNGFWRAFTVNSPINTSRNLNTVIAPGAHEGFNIDLTLGNSDIRFIKDSNSITVSNTDNVTIVPVNIQGGSFTGPNDINPEYAFQFTSTNANTSGETTKALQFPVGLHVNNYASESATISFWAKSITGLNIIQPIIVQSLGTGAATTSFPLQQIQITGQWAYYTLSNFTFPATTGSLSQAGDDAFFLRFNMPLNTGTVTTTIQLNKPSIFFGNTAGLNELMSYDTVNSLTNSPRTGDNRTSVNSFYSYGWVPANDGTIGNASSNATCRANTDVWQLFNLLWNYSHPYDSGFSANSICQMYNSAGVPINYGVSAYADFIANNALGLTETFGAVIAGSVPVSALLSRYLQTLTASDDGSGNLLITVPVNSYVFNGAPIVFTTTGTLPGGLSSNNVYYASNVNSGHTTFTVSTNYSNALIGSGLIAYASAGSGSSVQFYISNAEIGENFHTLSIPEMPSHNHPPLSPGAPTNGFVNDISSGGNISIAFGGNAVKDATTGNTGGGLGHNTMQITTFRNIFIKL